MFTVEAPAERLDKYLASVTEYSRSRIQNAIAAGEALVNDNAARPGDKLKPGDVVTLAVEPPREAEVKAEDIPIEIVYQDEYMAVINKPQGNGGAPRAGSCGRHAGGCAAVAHRRFVRHRRRAAPRHRAPAGQGHFGPDRDREKRCGACRFGRADGRQERAAHLPRHRARRLHGGRDDHRQEHRTQPHRPQEDGDRPWRAPCGDAYPGCWSASANLRTWKRRWRRAAHTRSACTCPASAARWPGTPFTVPRRRVCTTRDSCCTRAR